MREDGELDRLDFDRLMDAALGTYADADSGLERRVLARIAAERAGAKASFILRAFSARLKPCPFKTERLDGVVPQTAKLCSFKTDSCRRLLRRMAWPAVLAAAGCLLLFFVLTHARSAHAPGTVARNTLSLQRAPKAMARVAPRNIQRGGGLAHRMRPEYRQLENAGKSVAARLPKQEMFPMPRPLSPEEQALTEFAAQAPEAERESFVAAQEQADEPIAIAAIRIDPIQIPPLELPQAGTN